MTLSSVDPRGAAQGLLLKVQALTSESAGALSVSYDPRAGGVRVSALRLAQRSWTSYPLVPAVFAAGDRLGARARADGSVEVYRNGALLGTVVLDAADTAFFASRGGRIGVWTVAAGQALLDDFGGGSLAAP